MILISDNSNWNQMARLHQSGQVLQKKTFSSKTGQLLINSSIAGNGNGGGNYNAITPMSRNSTILVSFDCDWSISGSENDSWNSYIQYTVGANLYDMANLYINQ